MPDTFWSPSLPGGVAGEGDASPSPAAVVHSPVWFGLGVLSKGSTRSRSEEHTSELQSQFHLVCRLLLEKKNPTRRAERVRRPRRAVGIVLGELARELLRDRDVERRRQRRRRQRLGTGDAERGQQEGQRDEQPRPAYEARIDRPLDGAAAGPRTRRNFFFNQPPPPEI